MCVTAMKIYMLRGASSSNNIYKFAIISDLNLNVKKVPYLSYAATAYTYFNNELMVVSC